MTSDRKYAALPDLDPAPDIYETPELTDDTSTLPTSTTARSESAASSYNDPNDNETTGISRQRLDPDEARTHFLASDAQRGHVRTSWISSKRKSYQASRKTRQKTFGLVGDSEDLSDGEDESLERKISRLRQEVAEVKGECERRNAGNQDDSNPKPSEAEASLEILGRLLGDINAAGDNDYSGAASRLTNQLEKASRTYENSANGGTAELDNKTQQKSTYTMTHPLAHQHDNTLAKVADFDARLTMLETVLGVETIPLPTQDASPTAVVIPTLNTLDKQIATLSSSTELSLESLSRRMRQLTEDAEKLDEARKSAKAAQDELIYRIPPALRNDPSMVEEATSEKVVDHHEQTSKINALYGTLSTIESLSPLLPSLLDRLRSLRYIHADAATAGQNLAKVEARQEAMLDEIKGWTKGLMKVEEAVEQGEKTINANTKTVESWVKELEDRMQRLDL